MYKVCGESMLVLNASLANGVEKAEIIFMHILYDFKCYDDIPYIPKCKVYPNCFNRFIPVTSGVHKKKLEKVHCSLDRERRSVFQFNNECNA